MSKCDLEIIFDRPDRAYRTGEEITGAVSVVVNQDLECNRLLLEHFWQTHGRGNTATGPKEELVLDRGNWRVGDTFNHRFRFTAPAGPPTYHGHYLNIDHFVRVRVDIPWAVDVSVQEDYVLLPGGAAYGNLPPSLAGRQAATQPFAKVGLPLGAALIIAGVIFMCPLGIVLIPLGCFLLFFALRKSLAESKMGQIAIDWGRLEVAPGEAMSLRLAFTPRKPTRLNGVAARLTGVERCVSGSGTDKKTHTHNLHDETVVLLPESDLLAGQAVRIEGNVPIPPTDAYSFSAPSNDVVWTLELRVDIPSWPDWVEKRVLTVRPALDLGAGGPIAATILATPVDEGLGSSPFAEGGFGQAETPAAEDEPLEMLWTPPREEEPVGLETPEPDVSSDPALEALAGRLTAASRYGPERQAIIDEVREQSFRCAVIVERVDRTISFGIDERFRDGRTVIGAIPNTDCKVAVQLSEVWNDRVESLPRGSRVAADCRLVKWNNIYDRLDVEEA